MDAERTPRRGISKGRARNEVEMSIACCTNAIRPPRRSGLVIDRGLEVRADTREGGMRPKGDHAQPRSQDESRLQRMLGRARVMLSSRPGATSNKVEFGSLEEPTADTAPSSTARTGSALVDRGTPAGGRGSRHCARSDRGHSHSRQEKIK